jgi:hypothetical protein
MDILKNMVHVRLLVFLSLCLSTTAFSQDIKEYIAPVIHQAETPVLGKATGFVHVEQIDGVWWFIRPDGKAFFDIASCHVGGINEPLRAYLQEKNGDSWRQLYYMQSNNRMREWSFTSLGNWSEDVIPYTRTHNQIGENDEKFTPLFYYANIDFRNRFLVESGSREPIEEDREKRYGPGENQKDRYWLEYSDGWRLGTTFRYIRRMPDPFNQSWRKEVIKSVEEEIKQGNYINDKYLTAYFTDNELPPTIFGEKGAAIWSPACGDEFIHWLKKRYSSIDKLNDAWRLSGENFTYKSFKDLRKSQPSFAELVDTENFRIVKLVDTNVLQGMDSKTPLVQDLYEFERHIYQTYFTFQVNAIKSVDPNHMVISNRYPGSVHTVETWKNGYMGRIADLLSVYDIVDVNLYPQLGRDHHVKSRLEILQYMYEKSGRPIINGECGIAARTSGIPSAPWWEAKTVDTQLQRGIGYKNILSTLANLPFMIGFQWYKWEDGTEAYLRNCGLIDSENKPYHDMIWQVEKVNAQIKNMKRDGEFGIADIQFSD